ncbi:hypothetical protein BCR33DRAFT_763568 [Rhizoclosmatium globosum]|uniref:Ribosomal RNA-processing protein 42 n=1 Tax=Rhizoclosmatium globosum TaxID=329046 RepID=A0A1Y2CQB7_9FUNG|nr:hypothetical protein BCR33DRAFT_763568 [Rhizoclosmatium globosum]|eukprot:ORY49147.1 hypothetical protein BCR33DRAFT_763568 [Rhizoclosmatium globosum]
MISVCERDYIIGGVQANARGDGRRRTDARPLLSFELGAVPQASGSAKSAALLVGVKVAIAEVSHVGAQADDDDDVETMNTRSKHLGISEDSIRKYSDFCSKLLNSDAGGLDLASLCFVPNTTCWVIHVDVLVLAYTGNLLDTMFQAIRAALANTLIPKVSVEESGSGLARSFEFDVADEETEELKGVNDIPAVVTLYKIGNYHVIDPTPLEELCSDVQLTVAISRKGLPCAIHKYGSGSVDPSLLADMIQDAKKHGLASLEWMDREIQREKLRLSNLE